MTSFLDSRRQLFLTETYYRCASASLESWIQQNIDSLKRPEIGTGNLRSEARFLFSNRFELLMLRYTAGEPIETLRLELDGVIDALEIAQRYLVNHVGFAAASPLSLSLLDEYERCLQLLSLCFLMHRRDLMPRIAAVIDPADAGQDALFEDLMDFCGVGPRYEAEDYFFEKPYEHLFEVIDAQSEAEAYPKLVEYCEAWYKAMADVPWHDSHLRMTETDGDYFGYWAFEAGVAAFMAGIDDDPIDHLVYPKDLVAWSRSNAHLASNASEEVPGHNRVESGQPCPASGWWMTPARENSRRYFKEGETMPAYGNAYGLTIWQWDVDQSSPTL